MVCENVILWLANKNLDDGIISHWSNTTHIVVVFRHHNVSFHSPLGTPTVLQQPIGCAFQFAVTNCENTMIEENAWAPATLVNSMAEIKKFES